MDLVVIAATGALVGVGWGLAWSLRNQRNRWRAVATEALGLNEKVLAANDKLIVDLMRATVLIQEHGLWLEFLHRLSSEGQQQPQNALH